MHTPPFSPPARHAALDLAALPRSPQATHSLPQQPWVTSTWPSWLSRRAPAPLHRPALAPQHGPALARWHGPALVGHARHPTHCWQAERYEEMVEYMKKVAQASVEDLSLEVRRNADE